MSNGTIFCRNAPDMFNEYTQPEDFLSDDSFLAWHYKTNPKHMDQWDQWIGSDTERETMVLKAIDLLNVLKVSEEETSVQQVDTAETLLMQKIQLPRIGRNRLISRFIWIAAASVLIIGGSLLIKSLLVTRPAIKTNYGEIKEQKLPDGTDVKLNANSKVSYSWEWKEGEDREVWLKGEAFFHVSKTAAKSRFIVHTDHFDVIVTGTQFNVVNRNGQSNVMLNEGSVIIRSQNGNEMHMLPGEFVEFKTNQPQKRIIRNDSLLAWRDRRLVFENTPLSDVVLVIRNHYGVEIKLADDAIGAKTISGMLPNDNLDVLLQSIDATNDFEVVHRGHDISIKSRQ